jgi:DNA end-binding protein Ku
MHTMWKGAIQFGLVNIPIKMYSATENKDIKFRYLHKECHTPVQYVRMCPNCKREVNWDEIVKGFEYQPDRFVIVEEEEFKALAGERSKTIDILDFVDLKEIDPIYFDKSYYLAPEDTSQKAYKLLQTAMEKTGKIAIAKVVIRSAETLAAIRIYNGVIVMETIFYPDEVRSIEQLPRVAGNIETSERELEMATQLIESLATEFEPSKYTDEYRKALTEMIESKIQGEEITVSAPKETGQVIDLMRAVQESLELTKKTNPPAENDKEQKEGEVKQKKAKGRKKKAAGE